MVIISRPTIKDFISRHPKSANPVNEWYEKTKEADWSKFADVKKTFPAADFIGNDRYVFDIAGNHFRLVAMIHFKKRTLYIRRILTHAEYTGLGKRGELNTL